MRAPHNHKYDGLDVYLPRVERLRPGDILLTRNRNGRRGRIMSALIASVTGGSFSHVLICAVPPTMIEAMPEGVGALSLHRCFAHSLKNVRVLRHPNPDVARAAGGHALEHRGRIYSNRRALASVFPEGIAPKLKNRGIFCSALVAHTFKQAGDVGIFNIPIEKTTPSTIEKLLGLLDVTDDIFEKSLSPQNIEEFVALDGNRIDSPGQRETKIMLTHAAKILPDIDELSLNYPEAKLTPPDSFTGIIPFIVSAFEAGVSLPNGSKFHAALRDLDSKTADLIDQGELDAVADEMISHDQAAMQRDLAESFDPDPDLDTRALVGIMKATKEQLASRIGSRDALARRSGGSKAVASWLRYQGKTIPIFEQRATITLEILDRLSGPRPGPHR